MGSIAVFVLGFVAVIGASGLITRFWATEAPPTLALLPDEPWTERTLRVVHRASAMMAAAVVAGVLVLGLGGRLIMRLLAATSPERAQGRLTDAEEVVGKVTLDGSVSFVLFVGVFGGLLSLGVFVLLRRWLPRRSVNAGIVIAGIGGGLFARPTGFISPDNRDFVILSPAWLAVLSTVLIVGLYGVLFAVLVDRWAARWPTLDRTAIGVLAAVPFAALFLLSVLAILPAIIIVVMVAFAVFARPRLGERPIVMGDLIGRRFTIALGLVGGAWVMISAFEILRL